MRSLVSHHVHKERSVETGSRAVNPQRMSSAVKRSGFGRRRSEAVCCRDSPRHIFITTIITIISQDPAFITSHHYESVPADIALALMFSLRLLDVFIRSDALSAAVETRSVDNSLSG